MASPNTVTLREDTFRALLTDIVHSFQVHGFKKIILIGDSGGNQAGTARRGRFLTAIWKGNPIVAHIQEYYDYAGVVKYMESHGIVPSQRENLHDDPIITLNMFITDPKSVRYDERVKAGKARINGDVDRRSREEHGAREADRRLPRDDHGRGDQQSDREQGNAPSTAARATSATALAVRCLRMPHAITCSRDGDDEPAETLPSQQVFMSEEQSVLPEVSQPPVPSYALREHHLKYLPELRVGEELFTYRFAGIVLREFLQRALLSRRGARRHRAPRPDPLRGSARRAIHGTDTGARSIELVRFRGGDRR